MTPFFSIIVPTYNRANLIAETLETVLDQSFKELEVIVVDDGSVDNTFEVIQRIDDNRLHYFKTSNGERARARNIGASLARGMYVNFFDSDDVLLLQLDRFYNFLLNSSYPPVVYGGIEIENKEKSKIYTPKKPYKSFTENLLFDNFLACGAVFLKREIALEFPFHEERVLSSAEDWELWLRVHSKYDFTEFPCKILKQVYHDARSLTTIDAEEVEKRDTYFISVIQTQDAMLRKYGKKALKLFLADRFTFIALCYSEKGQVSKAYLFWRKAIHSSALVLKRKRFWAVLKKLF